MQPFDQSDPLYKHKHDLGPDSLPVYFFKNRKPLGLKRLMSLPQDLFLKNLRGLSYVKDCVQNGVSLLSVSSGPLL